MMQDCLNQFQILFQAIQFCFTGWRQLRTGKDHWNSPTPWTYQLYAYIFVHICAVYIYIYSISPFCACFFSFFPSSFHSSSRRGFIPQLSRLWGANLTTSTFSGAREPWPSTKSMSRTWRGRWIGGNFQSYWGYTGSFRLPGERGVPTPSLHKRVQKADLIRDGAAFWWFFWKQRYGGLQKRFWEGWIWRAMATTEFLFPWILKQFGHVHSKTVWTFAREQRIKRACVTLPSNSELVWCALKHDLSQTRRLHNFRDAAFKVKKFMAARIKKMFARIHRRSKLGMSMPPTLIVSVITPWAESETAMQPDAI